VADALSKKEEETKGSLCAISIKTLGLLQPLSIPSQCWEEVSMDFIIGLPKSEGKIVIMVVVE
jgi:hypothetical protein